MPATFRKSAVTPIWAIPLTLLFAASTFGATFPNVTPNVPNKVLFELRSKNGGNQGALERFEMDLSGTDSNVVLDSTTTLGNINGIPNGNVYSKGWTTGPEPAGTRGHINGGVAPSSSQDNIIAQYRMQIYDSDGVFRFTEDIDDRVRISVNNVDPFHEDGAWNTRTTPVWNDDDGQGGGWYDVRAWLIEDGGGAGQVSAPGFAFDNDLAGSLFVIDGNNWQGDIDPQSGIGLGAYIVPEPATAALAMLGLAGALLGGRRRRHAR